MRKTRLSKIFEKLESNRIHISEYEKEIEEFIIEESISTGTIKLEEAKDLTKIDPNHSNFSLSSLPDNESARVLILNKVTDEEGYRYKVPMLSPTSETYLKDYADFVTMKFINKDNFDKMLKWD